ncbi:MAG: ion transporter [Planctomycetota bacterium]|jgi:voltage-gated potassium channel
MADTAKGWREHWYEVIFEADTRAGKAFDVLLLIAILLSVLTVVLESVAGLRERYGRLLFTAEWVFTILFTFEYAARIACAPARMRYVRSLYGVIDLLAIVPTYFMVLFPGAQTLAVLRALRLLRVFRVLKLAHMLREASALRRAFWASRSKIAVFLSFVVIVVVILGTAMSVVEGPEAGFTSIPQSMYWAVVTMTTVGYGDIAPHSPLGKALAALIMILGYSLIVVPTGLVTAQLVHEGRGHSVSTQVCPGCMAEGHDVDAKHCKYCGDAL